MENTKLTLPVKLTEEEVAIRSQELAEAELARQVHTAALSSAADCWREEKKRKLDAVVAAAVECGRLARVVKYREEPREVKCVATVEHGQYIVTRTDTGEVVTQRHASNAEAQMTLEDAGTPVDAAGGRPPTLDAEPLAVLRPIEPPQAER